MSPQDELIVNKRVFEHCLDVMRSGTMAAALECISQLEQATRPMSHSISSRGVVPLFHTTAVLTAWGDMAEADEALSPSERAEQAVASGLPIRALAHEAAAVAQAMLRTENDGVPAVQSLRG